MDLSLRAWQSLLKNTGYIIPPNHHLSKYMPPSYILMVLVRFGFMVFEVTFNNISVISWWSVLLVEETRVPGENHRPAAKSLTNFIT